MWAQDEDASCGQSDIEVDEDFLTESSRERRGIEGTGKEKIQKEEKEKMNGSEA